MKAVRARLGDGINNRAAKLPIFGVEAVGDQPELLDGIEIGN
jgi:hypothetical protein